jgi:flavodoxin
MRTTTSLWCAIVLLTAVCAGSLGAETPKPAHGTAAVIYFSQTGNTRAVCEVVAKELSADVFELKIVKPPAAKGQLPEIEPARIDLSHYAVVVVASPIWAAKLVPAVQEFLKNNPLGGRKAVLLTTTNVPMPEEFQNKHKQLVADAGGKLAGYYQVVVQEQKDGKAVARTRDEIASDAKSVAAKIKQALAQ